ncbi:MAG: DNA-3-methyladenine glycosylase 2 family protein, partial [Prevotellaceae bacterium]|nr:DNA-3-methyladenine glycosylase 2 family protein [Prevotellaceae bacterium]
MTDYFKYGTKEIEYLKRADKSLAAVIERIGMIERPVIPDIFSALVHSIVGQQISTKAHHTVWERMKRETGKISPDTLDCLSLETLQQFGMTFRKAAHIKSAARKIAAGEFDIDSLHSLPDEEVRLKLSELDGIGI